MIPLSRSTACARQCIRDPNRDGFMPPTMPSNARDHKRPRDRRIAAPTAAEAWETILALRRRARLQALVFPLELELADAHLTIARDGGWRVEPEPAAAVAALLELYLP